MALSSWRFHGRISLPRTGTVIPPALKLVKGVWNEKYQAHHWQIEVATGGELRADALRGALDNLARNCVVHANELGISLK